MSAWYNPNDNTVYGSHDNDIVGTYLGKVSDGDFKSINYVWNRASGSTDNTTYKIQYATETSSGTTCPMTWDPQPICISGPVRTATYTTAADTMTQIADTAGFTWHVDYDIPEGRLIAYDTNGEPFKPLSQKAIEKANKKSMKLLKEWLSDAEYKYLMEEGNLELPSQHEKDTIYIVNKDPMKRIGIKKKGKVVQKSLCIHASHAYPTGDILLANIMLLKTDEKKFLEIANIHEYTA